MARFLLWQNACELYSLLLIGSGTRYLGAVLAEQDELQLAAPRGSGHFYCAIHGTVSRCPFCYLWCTDDAADGWGPRPHVSDWAAEREDNYGPHGG